METGVLLSGLLNGNDDYNNLVKAYPDKVKTTGVFMKEQEFVAEELNRIKNEYLKPLKVQVHGGKVTNFFDYTQFSKYAYDCLKMGLDPDLSKVIEERWRNYPGKDHTEKALFTKSMLAAFQRGAAFVMYEKFLKERYSLSDQTNKVMDAFISYSWDSKAHEDLVISFTNHLRKNGYQAEIDKMKMQQHSAIDFVVMMHKAVKEYKKIIIVLSAGYKQKAEVFKGGVGEEYSLIIKDIKENQKKYIFVSFDGINEDVIPLGLKGREIIDLSKDGWERSLFSKLNDQDLYQFAAVAAERPSVQPEVVPDFKELQFQNVFESAIECRPGEGVSQWGLFRSIKNECQLIVTNTSGKTITGYAPEVHIPKQLIEDYYNHPLESGNVIIRFDPAKKLFPGMSFHSPKFTLKVTASNCADTFNNHFRIVIYTDTGMHENQIPIRGTLKGRDRYNQVVPLTEESFLGPEVL